MIYTKTIVTSTTYKFSVFETRNPLISIVYIFIVDGETKQEVDCGFHFIWTKDVETYLDEYPNFVTEFPKYPGHEADNNYELRFVCFDRSEVNVNDITSQRYYDYMFKPNSFNSIPDEKFEFCLHCSYDNTWFDLEGKLLSNTFRDFILSKYYKFDELRKISKVNPNVSIIREEYYVHGNGKTIDISVTVPTENYLDIKKKWTNRIDSALKFVLTEEQYKRIKK